MRLVFAGTPEVAVPALEALVASRHEVVGVVTRQDAPAGRGRKLTPSPVAERAAELGIETVKPASPKDPEFQEWLRSKDVDVCPVVAYGALLPTSALEIPRFGWVNLHFSVLPRWRGAAPVQRAIMAGDAVIGTTCFQIVKALDAGDIYRVAERPMPEAPAGAVLALLAREGAQQLVDTVDAIEAGETPVPQPEDGVTYAHKITVDDARLDWTRPAVDLLHHVRGCSPDPGAWCLLDGQRFKVYDAALADGEALAPGQVQVTKRAVLVGTDDGVLELVEVQAPGKKRMRALDWARGAKPEALS
ncbi:methionyl-tRNA formyltransferase [Tessaracoccus caeni]|uniref:methionyl-tRNA formyltransferase n=1 Tax=Tessaracoccus caeni TaxID=3031239 RepID=UPI0023DC8AE9|nr:methionyl-tRNA formyltransferase [Tessaracoccus caeni]MDF1489966.1 methionyl-tRNA formyltransferase [Tessaracoccus caeni]